MITAVDTSVLLDVLTADPRFGVASKQAIRRCLGEGSLVACEAVIAETSGFFPTTLEAAQALEALEVRFDPLVEESALAAGRAWAKYREHGGKRGRVVADFLIGAHATGQADRLLTRDRGFYRGYFSELSVLDPAER